MATKHPKLLGLVCLLILASCSLQKRIYNKGFYISKHHAIKKTEQKPNTDTLPAVLNCVKQIKAKAVPVTLSAEVSNKVIEIEHVRTKPTPLTDGCDTLVLRNGTVMLAKILEITPEQIKFRYCDSPNEVLRVINKNDVNHIIYSNGLKEVFEYKQPNAPYYYPPPRKTNGFAIAGFSLGIFDVFLSGAYTSSSLSVGAGLTFIIPFAILVSTVGLCIMAIIQITRNRESQKGITLAVIGLILSLLILTVVITTVLL